MVSGIFNETHWWSHEQCLSEFKDCLPALIHLDNNPQLLINHLAALKTKRLGLKFEALLAYWLRISPNYTLLLKNYQIIENGITLGEIDFIIKELSSQKIIHLEVAVKFYLGTPPYEDDLRWFGTNTNDQLGKKLEHLKQHQTQLSRKYKKHFKYTIDEHHCFIKGRLFYPTGKITPPTGVTENHLRGSWYHFHCNANNTDLIPISKSDWLAELNHTDITKKLKNPEKYSTQRAQCFVNIKSKSGSSHTQEYQEENRVFILPNNFTFPR